MKTGLVLVRCFAAALVAMVICRFRVATIRRIIAAKSAVADDPTDAAIVARWLTPVYSWLRRRPSCFEKAIALSLALRWNGIASRVILGGEAGDGKFHAHAWVSAAGQEFFRDSDRDYEPLAAL